MIDGQDYNYADLNITELVELAKKHGALSAHRGMGKPGLIQLIKGTADPSDFSGDPADDEREGMMRMKEEWPEVYHQLKCSDENYACWDCPPARAVACAVEECEPKLLQKVKNRGVE